uniref:EamA domain-containing protein n=1 Tax=Rhabditophanes sp. KR3021 TaxID=114890 RepID=A0AC35TIS1_9BILA
MSTPIQSMLTKKSLGMLLLVIVNLLWVFSAEVTRYIFVDLDMKRPLLLTYIKSCMFSVYLLKFLLKPDSKQDSPAYTQLQDNQQEDTDFEAEELEGPEFEPIVNGNESEYESDTSVRDGHRRRSVRFAQVREIRRIPESIAEDARRARTSYRPPSFTCYCKVSPMLKYSLYFCPLWFFSSTTYQAALMFSSVSSVNLISASSSLFVLAFTGLFPRTNADRFSFIKLVLVLANILGVALVSQFSESFIGSMLALVSSVAYAIYLTGFAILAHKHGNIDINILFGAIGLFSVFICTPIMFLVHHYDIEPQLPFPTTYEVGMILLAGFIGSVLGDYLWLKATALTSSLISSLSMSLSIPLSMVADSFFRGKLPSPIEMVAAIPIMLSFVGAAYLNKETINLTNNAIATNTRRVRNRTNRPPSPSGQLLLNDDEPTDGG